MSCTPSHLLDNCYETLFPDSAVTCLVEYDPSPIFSSVIKGTMSPKKLSLWPIGIVTCKLVLQAHAVEFFFTCTLYLLKNRS